MTVHMTGMYTRLVTYARLHIWELVVCFISSILLPADYHVISYLSVTFSFMIILLPFICSVSCCDICRHYLYARASSLFLTHSLGHFLTTLNLHVQILTFFSLIRCSVRRSHALRGVRVLLLDRPFSVLSCLSLFVLFPWLCALDSYLFYSSIHLCRQYMYSYSEYHVIIVDIYSLFWLL